MSLGQGGQGALFYHRLEVGPPYLLLLLDDLSFGIVLAQVRRALTDLDVEVVEHARVGQGGLPWEAWRSLVGRWSVGLGMLEGFGLPAFERAISHNAEGQG